MTEGRQLKASYIVLNDTLSLYLSFRHIYVVDNIFLKPYFEKYCLNYYSKQKNDGEEEDENAILDRGFLKDKNRMLDVSLEWSSQITLT
jgi:hypothetical protein